MVLLDSEGIDAVRGEGLDDNQIFTLTVLLASVLIYNSAGVPTRHDLNGLEYPLITCSKNPSVRTRGSLPVSLAGPVNFYVVAAGTSVFGSLQCK